MGLSGPQLQDLEVLVRARLALYTPGQPMAIELSKNPTVLVVNDTVFAHGGLLPIHVEYGIERINAEVAAWMRGDQHLDGSLAPPPFIALGYAPTSSVTTLNTCSILSLNMLLGVLTNTMLSV
jgi:hypothetical protein